MEGNVMVRTRFRVYVWFVRLKWIIVQTLAAVTLIIFLLWMSVFLYGTFYYMYMPVVSHEWPVHLKFRTDCDIDGRLCSFPMANLSLMTSRQKPVLIHGQAYVVKLEMEMPESYVNQNLGMFMIQIQFYTRNGETVFTSSRSALLYYKSFIHRTVETVFFIPSLLFRSFSQKQMVTTELSNNYYEDPYRPTFGVVIEVQNKKVQIYNGVLKIHASFSGLRYLLFYWPTLSAIFGIFSNFFFLSIVALFSWLAYLAKSSGELQKTTDIQKCSENEDSLDKSNTTKTVRATDASSSNDSKKPNITLLENLKAAEASMMSSLNETLLRDRNSVESTVRKRKL